MDEVMQALGSLWGTVTLPFDVMSVFSSFKDIWNALPLIVRLVFMGCLVVSCLFSVLRMLTR